MRTPLPDTLGIRLPIGDHDDRANFARAFPDIPRTPDGFVQSVDDTSAGRFLYLDTHEPGTHAGHVCAARREWLGARLDEARRDGVPVRLFMHHNPLEVRVLGFVTRGIPSEGPPLLVANHLFGIVDGVVVAALVAARVMPLSPDRAKLRGMDTPHETPSRRDALALWSLSTRDELERALGAVDTPDTEDLRPPETGLVMARARMGGTGAPFNVGDVAVSRATVRLGSGEIGFGHVLGTDKVHARLCAVCDALWQARGAHAPALAALLERIGRRVERARAAEAEATAATRVDFFTMTRGEDART